jgi:hypothetical protein
VIEAFLSNPFWWIGVFTSAVLIGVCIGFALLAIVAAWQTFGPQFHCRRPGAINVWSTFRSDVRDHHGERVKGGEDMRIVRLIGCSWRLRWYVGLITFSKDDGK